MMKAPLRAAGIAMVWRSIQMGGVKVVFMIRLLVLAILLTPADFGLVAIAITATGFLLNLTNFGLISAVVQADNMNDEKYNAAWTFELTRSILVAGLTIAFAPLIAAIFAEPRATPIIQAIALRPVIESLTSIRVAAMNRNLVFRPLALLKIIEAVANVTISISLAKSFGVWAIVFGMLGGVICMVIASYFLAPYRPRILFNWRVIEPLIKFGGWLFITSVIAMIGNYGLRIIISRQLGTAGLGLYFLAVQLAFLPSEVANEVVGAVAFPLFARLRTDVHLATRVFHSLFSGLAAALFPVCALIIVLAPSLPRDILGSKWTGTEDLIRILALVVLIGIYGEIAVTVFKGFGRPYVIAILELMQSSITITAVWLLTPYFGLLGAALAWLPSILFSQIISMRFLQGILDHPFRSLSKPLMAIITITGTCAAIALATRNLIPGIVGFITSGVLGIVSAAVLLWIADRQLQLGFVTTLTMVFREK